MKQVTDNVKLMHFWKHFAIIENMKKKKTNSSSNQIAITSLSLRVN